MDYLDPNKKKKKKTRLMVGYTLLGIAITLATIIFVYLANGYYIDGDSGTVIQNGLIYIDSKPESADVYLNGEKQGSPTDARLVVPEGKHKIGLFRDGYRDWNRNVSLVGGSLRRITYARLIPNELESENMLDLPSIPTMTSQSIDKRWLILGFDDNPLLLRMVDLNREVPLVEEVPLPLNTLNTKEKGSWEVLDWADDNRTFLAEYKTATSSEFVLIDRAEPALAKNLKNVFSQTKFTSASLRDRKNNLVFLHDKPSGSLYVGNASNAGVELNTSDVIEYVAFANDSLLYVSAKDANEGYVKSILKHKDTNYELRSIKSDSTYLLDLSKLGNALVMGVGSTAEGKVIVYNDPINAIKNNDFSKLPVATTVLRVDKPTELTISSDSSTILVKGTQQMSSHEFEEDLSYKFKLDKTLDANHKLYWMDGQHITYSSEGKQYVIDFDGSNNYELVKSDIKSGSYFSNDIDEMFTFSQEATPGSPARLIRTFMLSNADR